MKGLAKVDSMTPAAEILRREIEINGPIPFRRFMETALYHPEHGYYRLPRDPFGREGDYFTAEQIQPVFGILISRLVRDLVGHQSKVVELGAGRGEMSAAFQGLDYVPVDIDRGAMPARFRGVVFANEFFDALPVELVRRGRDGFRRMMVGWRTDRFCFVEGSEADAATREYINTYLSGREVDTLIEVNLAALAWIDEIARSLERGFLLVIDYGYTARESIRFPAGTLMSYRRHQAIEDVLRDPGRQDITSHVNFSALELHATNAGFRTVRFENLSRTLLDAGERDQFAEALAAEDDAQGLKRRLQLKTLLFGMGETFRTLLLQK